jgi:hypothetical protein
MKRAVCTVVLTSAIAAIPALVDAQVYVRSDRPRLGTVEVSGGGTWAGGQDLTGAAATLTVNPAGGRTSFEQFDSDPTLDPAFGVQGTVAVYLTRALAIEGGVQFSRPELKVRLSNDFEDAPDVTASTMISTYVFTGSLVYHFGSSGRTVPFIAAGAGHLRDVHTSNELVETGTEFHGNAGIKMWFDRRRKLGLRAEGGLSVRDGGFSFEDERRTVPTAAVSLLYLF